MFPDNHGPTTRRSRPLPLLIAAAVAASAIGGALWWKGQTPATPEFQYLHGQLTAPPPATGEETAFEITGPSGTQRFTMAQLRAMPAVRYTATQPQLKRTFEYTGVPLRDLADRAGLNGQDLRIIADDDFASTVPKGMYMPYPTMLAYEEDGHEISTAHKGPLMVVLPNGDHPELKQIYAQWVWFSRSMKTAP
ncbi:hypothetical protein GCM10008939_34990 [Deinococcus aquiradiocola]|uniref:Oxidoreductase molybdopterin-binding domain-containing protein n=1 Tax=Deinococcus aquiradiocola TaxID=393059 RepID=A0A917PQC3_9DEIO|nr:hypothetical protein GCM10008939_34990 [Deinococcus aquiradiocola]